MLTPDLQPGDPVERCGAILPFFEGTHPTECVLRPGHQGSHANEYGTRWIEKAKIDTCLKDAALMADIGYPVRCPHCGTTVPPTHWTKHVQRHHPDEQPQSPWTREGRHGPTPEETREAVAGLSQPAAGYCPHCGRGDAGPTADEYEQVRRRAVALVERLDVVRDWARKHLDADQQSVLIGVLRKHEDEAPDA